MPTSSCTPGAVSISLPAPIEAETDHSPAPDWNGSGIERVHTAVLARASSQGIPLPDLVLCGPAPFNAALSPHSDLQALHPPAEAFHRSDLRDVNAVLSLEHIKSDGGGQNEQQRRHHPVQNRERDFSDSPKVMGQTKDVVASNDERVADLDNVIRPSAAQEKKRSRAEGLPPCHPSHLPTPLPLPPLPPMLRPVPSAKFSTSPVKSSTKPKLWWKK